MCTYAAENPKYLNECFNSIHNQTLQPTQFVLVCDGQLTVELYNVIESWLDRFNLMVVHYDGDGKLGGALNFGLQFCQHEIVARMDSVDVCFKDRFERQMEAFNEEVDLVSMDVIEFEDDINRPLGVRKVPNTVNTKNISIRNPVNHMAVAFRKTKIIEVGGYQSLTSL